LEERLSARRFAEYLSLGETPDASARSEPPPAAPATERWVPPDEELVPAALTADAEADVDGENEQGAPEQQRTEGSRIRTTTAPVSAAPLLPVHSPARVDTDAPVATASTGEAVVAGTLR